MKASRAPHRFFNLLTILSFSTSLLAAEGAWQSRALDGIAAQEYDVSWQDNATPSGERGAWQAPNRSHNLRSTFTETGLRVGPRLDQGPKWDWGLTLLRYGSTPVTTPRVSAHGNRFERAWGGIVEWYVNDARGLEHGFTLAAPPASRDTSEVRLDLELTGTLDPAFSPDGQAIDFRAPGGPSVIHYAGLKVFDSRGRDLPARMEGFAEAGARGVRIVFDDRDAVYPVTVDPLATSAAWTAESEQATANFGTAVAPAGDVNGDGYSDVIIGADTYDNGQANEGRAFVYMGSPSGLATTPAWTAESDQASANFGGSVAAAGDVNGDGYGDVIVGARSYDNGQTDEGRVFIYYGSPSGLSATAGWSVESDQASAIFGVSVATAGDVNNDGYADVIVGASVYDNGQTDEGRAYVYLGGFGGPSTTPAWTAESNQAAALFGVWVATAGDVNADGYADVIVGARQFDNGQTDEGRAFVYLGSASGLAAAAAWTAESDQATANFGRSAATAGDVNGDGYADVIVGAYTYDNGQADEGRAYVYLGSAAGLAVTPAWTAENDRASAQFGITVAPAGDVNGDGYADVVIGAYAYDNGQTDEGAAYVYFGSLTGLPLTPSWTVESGQASAQFGWSVATAGDVNGDGYSDVLVGANLFDNGQADEGRAFVYLGSATVPATTVGWSGTNSSTYSQFGWSVAAAGDVNGDGYGDVIVGAPMYFGGANEEGRAYVYYGSANGLASVAGWSAGTGENMAHFGQSVATAGDVNGDGYADVIVGVPGRGYAYVYLGSSTGLATSPAWSYFNVGESVSTAGDVNGDGYSDVIVASYSNIGDTPVGAALVFLGSASGLSPDPNWSVKGTLPSANFGDSVACAGDVNRDGYSDVIIGAPDIAEQAGGGRAFVYLGSASGLATSPVWTSAIGQVQGNYGGSVAGAGDVNGDGYSDVVVGGYKATLPGGNGGAWLFFGGPSGPSGPSNWQVAGTQLVSRFGRSVASAGDVNNDGYSDVLVGEYRWSDGTLNLGRAYVYLGSASGPSTTAGWIAAGLEDDAIHGRSVAGAGDVNGDGFSDVLVGVPDYPVQFFGHGLARLYYGNAGRGRDRAVRQMRQDGSAPIGLLGKSDWDNSIRIHAQPRSAAGRAHLRVASEFKTLGAPFDGSVFWTGAWSYTGAPVDQLFNNLTPGTLYRWRIRIGSDSPFFPWTPWLSPPGNARTEADLRTPICRDFDGDGYGSPGEAFCPNGPLADCNDGSAATHPGVTESCDGVDNNCDGTTDNVAVPVGSPRLTTSSPGGDFVALSWTAIPNATHYDVVRGSLFTLRHTGGDFAFAVDQCATNNRTSLSYVAPATAPAPGDGYFYLVRGVVGTCAPGTYDSGAPSQIGSRDAEISWVPGACP